MNKVRKAIEEKGSEVLNVYFTAGHPTVDKIVDIMQSLQENGVDLIELGLPYSDPLADGLAIQKSSEIALENGLNLNILFDILKQSKSDLTTPVIMMGYYNQMLQYGDEKFLDKAAESGVSGFIIPDLPMNQYESQYLDKFKERDLSMSFLISPMTEADRIRQADRLSDGFVYMVSQSSITGKTGEISDQQIQYFNRVKEMELESPRLIGFGIHDHNSFKTASAYADGAIVGSAFIRTLENGFSKEKVSSFIQSIRG
jgi:tryptophan synthase alpha chain